MSPVSLAGVEHGISTMVVATHERAYAELDGRLGGRLTRTRARLECCSRDFGGIVRRTPKMVVDAARDEDVLAVLEVAARNSVPVSLRGSGHSQAGQCLGEGIVIQTHALSAIRIDSDAGLVEVGAGATWKDVVDAAFRHRLLPLGLTHVTDTTVGGTLSVAGVGSESWRIGAHVNNVKYLDVATLDGRVVRCSPHENRELYDCTRAGLGQCAVILRVGYPVRPCKQRVRTQYFLYRDAQAYVEDVLRLRVESRVEFLAGSFTRAEAFGGRWAILLCAGKEFDEEDELDEEFVRSGLRFEHELPSQDAPLWNESGIPGHIFFRLHTGCAWDQDGAPAEIHPWIEHLFAPEVAMELFDRLLAEPSRPLMMGTNGIIPTAAAGERAPLLALPRGEGLLFGLGMFANVLETLKDHALSIFSTYGRRCCAAGGKRYLSGFVDFTTANEWADHYGDVWPWFREMKHRYDPHGLLNPGFLVWQ